MRYAVLSDVHANLEALRAVLADCRADVDGLLCLGDLVGYGADPQACIEIVAERAEFLVAGNHEHGVTGLLDLGWFNRIARAAAEWTATRLDTDHRAYLAALPLAARLGEATLVHASPAHPDEWDYLVTAEDGFETFAAFDTRLCFVGHSHRAACWSVGSSGPEFRPGAGEVTLDGGRRYIINVGSVGQPRDGDPRACYAIWDQEARRVAIRRVPYDSAGTRRKIIAAGLPRVLADRLAHGS
jgi:diadenosine tetraphosphatase ApaH/serine/threonine PP2A family protein phosphatase